MPIVYGSGNARQSRPRTAAGSLQIEFHSPPIYWPGNCYAGQHPVDQCVSQRRIGHGSSIWDLANSGLYIRCAAASVIGWTIRGSPISRVCRPEKSGSLARLGVCGSDEYVSHGIQNFPDHQENHLSPTLSATSFPYQTA